MAKRNFAFICPDCGRQMYALRKPNLFNLCTECLLEPGWFIGNIPYMLFHDPDYFGDPELEAIFAKIMRAV